MRLFTANEPGTSQKLATSGDHIRKAFPGGPEIVLRYGLLGIESPVQL